MAFGGRSNVLRGKEAASRLLHPCSHGGRRKMPRNTGILDRNARLHVGFREMTLSPSGRDSELGDPNLF